MFPFSRKQPAGSADAATLYLLAAVGVGITGGLAGTAFHLGVDYLAGIYSDLRQAISGPFQAGLAAAAISSAAALLAALIVRRIAPEAAGSGIQEVEGAMEGLRPMRWLRVLTAKFTGGLLALSSGLVLGREGPTIHMSAAAAAGISQGMGFTADDRRGLLAAGAAAGLAAAFSAPLAAILFIVEETRRQFPYGYRTYMAVILASIASGLTVESFLGTRPALEIDTSALPVASFPLFILLGGLLGALGTGFNSAVLASLDAIQKLPKRLWWLPPLAAGGLTGVLLIAFPLATGGGEQLVRFVTAGHLGLGLLLLLTVLRFAGVLASYSIAVPGGIFAPMLSIATCAGLAFGVIVTLLLPEANLPAQTFAIAAMGGFFAASVRAPLVAVVLVLELTGAYPLLLPVLVTCAAATLTAHALNGRPVYELLLERTLRLAGETPPAAEADRTPVQLGLPGN